MYDDFQALTKLTPQEAIKSTAGIEIEIKEAAAMDGGLSLEWSSMVDHPEQFNMNHELPRRWRLADPEFMVKPDAKDEDVEHLRILSLKAQDETRMRNSVASSASPRTAG